MFLAVDAGGTSTRAVVLDASGRVFGYGRAGGGNPTSAGVTEAVTAIGVAAGQAVSPVGHPRDRESVAVVAMAGEQGVAFVEQLTVRLAGLGFGRVTRQPDLLGVFHSGTPASQGYAMIAGTGTVAARVRDGRLERVVGGRGWLLGDAGSGFWIGHRVARAVVEALDGQGPATALTELVLSSLAIEAELSSPGGRIEAIRRMVSTVYARRPVQLSELAPLAFAAYDDPVARGILTAAADALAELVATTRADDLAGPLVVGGSVMVHGVLAAPPELRQIALPHPAEVIPVSDGVVGAAVLALRAAGVTVDAALFRTLQSEVANSRQRGVSFAG
jgi:glucosamine kinase